MSQTTSAAPLQSLLHDIRHALVAPSRNPRMAVVMGRLLAIAFLLCFGTGLYSHFIQEPLAWMTFPTRPIWLYQVSQGIHITAGIACFPLIAAKLYTVFPELFQSPPVRSIPHLIERASIALFVAASLVEITIGLLNTFQLYALFPFPFRQTHFALSFVVIGSLAIHIAIKLSTISTYWTKRRADAVERDLETHADADADADSVVSADAVLSTGVTGRIFRWIDGNPAPARPAETEPAGTRAAQTRAAGTRASSASRRGFFATVGVAVAAVVALTAGQSFRALDGINIFGPRKMGVGPQSLPVNRTAKAAKVTETAAAADWVLTVVAGSQTATFTRADLEAMPQREVELPIACVEGWSQYATWTGVRMRDLIAAVGAGAEASGVDASGPGASVTATSLEEKSPYAVSTLGPEWVHDDLTLIALQLNGEVLDLDHGYPARLIAPARPGVLQTKWLSRIEVNV